MSIKAYQALKGTGYEPLNIFTTRTKANLPAAVWRDVSVTERPMCEFNAGAVFVQDGAESVAVLSARHYDALVDRVRDLERWVGEFLEVDETPCVKE